MDILLVLAGLLLAGILAPIVAFFVGPAVAVAALQRASDAFDPSAA